MKRKYPSKPAGKKRKKAAESASDKDASKNLPKDRQVHAKRQKSRIISNPYAVSSMSGVKSPQRGADLYFQRPSHMENISKQREYIKKRNAIRHRKKRKKRMIVVSSFLGLLILASSLAVCITLFFNIESIEVIGESRYSSEEVLSHVNLQIGQNIFNFKKDEIEQQVLAALPYLETVAVKRKLPARVVVEVEPVQITNAIWMNDENCYLLLSQSGRAVDVASEVSDEIPRVIGAEINSYEIGKKVTYKTGDSAKYIIEIAQAMQKYGLTQPSTMDVEDKYSLRIIYDNCFIIELGSSSNLDYKVKFAATMIEDEESAGSSYGTFDVSGCVSGSGTFLEKSNSEFSAEAYGQTDDSESGTDGESASSDDTGSSSKPETSENFDSSSELESSSEPDTVNE